MERASEGNGSRLPLKEESTPAVTLTEPEHTASVHTAPVPNVPGLTHKSSSHDPGLGPVTKGVIIASIVASVAGVITSIVELEAAKERRRRHWAANKRRQFLVNQAPAAPAAPAASAAPAAPERPRRAPRATRRSVAARPRAAARHRARVSPRPARKSPKARKAFRPRKIQSL